MVKTKTVEVKDEILFEARRLKDAIKTSRDVYCQLLEMKTTPLSPKISKKHIDVTKGYKRKL